MIRLRQSMTQATELVGPPEFLPSIATIISAQPQAQQEQLQLKRTLQIRVYA